MVTRGPNAAVVLSVDSNGNTQLSVGGLVIELIEEIRIEVSGTLRPRIKVVFASTTSLPKGPIKTRVLEILHRYREILAEHPCVEVFDTVDTLPFMAAIKTDISDPKTKA